MDDGYTKVRGAAQGNAVDPNDPVDPLMDALFAEEVRVQDRIYPAWYAASLGRFRVQSEDVWRMRDGLSGIPRVDPMDYDILFNAETREWVIVRWVADLEPFGYVGRTFLMEMVRRPVEVYEIDARRRGPPRFSERDFAMLRSLCVTTQTGRALNQRLRDAGTARLANSAKLAADEETDFLGYHHALIRKLGEQSGMAYATPAEMAAKYGGRAEDWDPDHIPGVTTR